MQITRCSGCMDEIEQYPCPHCGFDPAAYVHDENALTPNTILHGQYLVGRCLGHGGFGITYIGLDLALNIRVAIKEYFPQGHVMRNANTGNTLIWNASQQAKDAQSTGMESFLKEARKMARVSHVAQVVNVRDIFQDGGTAYIVMDYIEGKNLRDILQERDKPLTWREAVEIFLPVITAMEQVHTAGLVHRDLSPDNLMLQEDGQVRILDLGAAKDLNINTGESSMLVAKGGFSPIEQYTQRGGSGSWTDVYAMAATMYYSITGILPPIAPDRLIRDTMDWNRSELKSVPAPVVEAMKAAMAVSPKERMQTLAPLRVVIESNKADVRIRQIPKWAKVLSAAAVVAAAAGILAFMLLRGSGDYRHAVALMKEGQYAEAISAFTALDGYRDSEERIAACENAILQEKYDKAVEWMDSGKYTQARQELLQLGEFLDSADLAEACALADLEERYSRAVTLKDSGAYDDAIGAFSELDGYKDSEAQIEACRTAVLEEKYEIAVAMLDDGDIIAAYEGLAELGDYRNSDELALGIFGQYKQEKIRTASVGDYVWFGSYEQDNDQSNGSEDIEWRVLAREDNKLLLLSRFVLDSQPYVIDRTGIGSGYSWSGSQAGLWLDRTFYGAAFDAAEKNRIVPTSVKAEKNPEYSYINPGPNVRNKVFLLSIAEADAYFTSAADRQAEATDFAIANDVPVSGDSRFCMWWLRNPGRQDTYAADVKMSGEIDYSGEIAWFAAGGMRPAIWITVDG